MTTYCGGKKKIAKHIQKFISDFEAELRNTYEPSKYIDSTTEYNDYIEPFCGMMSVGVEIMKKEPDRFIHITDLNPDLYHFWKEMKEGWIFPTTISEEKFYRLKGSEPSAERAFFASRFSFGSVYFGSYIGRYIEHSQVEKLFEKMNKKLSIIQDLLRTSNLIVYKTQSYIDLANSLSVTKEGGFTIYCDPPYNFEGTKTRHSSRFLKYFDSKKFWETMREWSQNNLVFISENITNIPEDFVIVWKRELLRKVGKENHVRATDCLVVHKPLYDTYSQIFDSLITCKIE